MNAEHETREKEGELSLDFLKRFVMYARMNCAPRLNEKAAEKLASHYVRMRNPTDEESENRTFSKSKHSLISRSPSSCHLNHCSSIGSSHSNERGACQDGVAEFCGAASR